MFSQQTLLKMVRTESEEEEEKSKRLRYKKYKEYHITVVVRHIKTFKPAEDCQESEKIAIKDQD